MTKPASPAPPSSCREPHVRATALLSEALAGAVQRPSRTVLTLAGIIIGVAAFVAVLGLTATASGQISDSFSVLRATSVTLQDKPDNPVATATNDFPADAETTIRALNGVTAAGITWPLPGTTIPRVATSLDPRATPNQIQVAAATPGYFDAIGATLAQGRPINTFHQENLAKVAVLGRTAASTLGITHLSPTPTVYIHGTGYAVVGIIADTIREPEALSEILIPSSVATTNYGPPSLEQPARMIIATNLGAARQIAAEAPRALRPDNPHLIVADPINDNLVIESHVTDALQTLLWGLAAITLLMGALGIANTTFTTVIERTHEIGLRRAIGARRRDILTQILTECASLGLLGGLTGTAAGTMVVLAIALANQWTALIDPAVTATGPVLGTAIALLAGTYPAHIASHVQPIRALRQ